MTTSDKLREIAVKWELTQADLEIWKAERRIVQTPIPEFLSDLTALISENYVSNEEVDKMVSERLREELIEFTDWIENEITFYIDRSEVDEYLKSRER